MHDSRGTASHPSSGPQEDVAVARDGAAPDPREHDRGTSDLGRRLRARRETLDRGRQEVAEEAGIAPSYLRYLEDEPSNPSPQTLRKLALALSTTAGALLGGAAGTPPGSSPPTDGAHLQVLPEAECWRLLGDHGVGRVAFTVDEEIVVLPVNYVVARRTVLVRTGSGTRLAESVSADGALSLEVDRLDEAVSGGWSVLVRGRAHRLDPDVDRESPVTVVHPWAGPGRTFLVGLRAEAVSGRRLLV